MPNKDKPMAIRAANNRVKWVINGVVALSASIAVFGVAILAVMLAAG
jgi:hypothetical protein